MKKKDKRIILNVVKNFKKRTLSTDYHRWFGIKPHLNTNFEELVITNFDDIKLVKAVDLGAVKASKVYISGLGWIKCLNRASDILDEIAS